MLKSRKLKNDLAPKKESSSKKEKGEKLPYQKPSVVRYEKLSRVWGMQE